MRTGRLLTTALGSSLLAVALALPSRADSLRIAALPSSEQERGMRKALEAMLDQLADLEGWKLRGEPGDPRLSAAVPSEPDPVLLRELLSPGTKLDGTWGKDGGYTRALFIRKVSKGRCAVSYHVAGCLLHWVFVRAATCHEGVVTLDRPVYDVDGDLFSKIYAVRSSGQEALVRSNVLKRLQEQLGESGQDEWVEEIRRYGMQRVKD
jgi:hypothetical protein